MVLFFFRKLCSVYFDESAVFCCFILLEVNHISFLGGVVDIHIPSFIVDNIMFYRSLMI